MAASQSQNELSHIARCHPGDKQGEGSESCSVVSNSVIPWTVACQAPLSMGFSRYEYWSGLPFPSPGDLPDPGIEPGSLTMEADSVPSEPPAKPSKVKRD